MDWIGESRRAGFTAFRNSVDDIITNVTLSSTPAAIIRQRRNAAAAVSRGIEVDARQRWRHFNGEISYLYSESRYVTLERLPQIPKHQGSMQLTYAHRGLSIAGGLRAYSFQFEDDLNRFLLPGYVTLQWTARQRLPRGFAVQAGLENALDRTYVTGFSPTPLIGAPRLWRLGMRWESRPR
ncbi:MAG: TonB-dependent receptor [Acidobacteria bacterium]|nr:TonB-dependent receptor [Acidobacteriota bacterium]